MSVKSTVHCEVCDELISVGDPRLAVMGSVHLINLTNTVVEDQFLGDAIFGGPTWSVDEPPILHFHIDCLANHVKGLPQGKYIPGHQVLTR